MMRSLVVGISLLSLFACSSVDYEKNISISADGWHKDSIAKFGFDIKRTDLSYQLEVYIRNTNAYPYSNLYLFVTIDQPDGAVVKDTAEYELADAYGRWLGKGWCANYDNDLLLNSSYRFPISGHYTVEIVQAMREVKLKGIKEVGFSLRKQTLDGKK